MGVFKIMFVQKLSKTTKNLYSGQQTSRFENQTRYCFNTNS